MSANHLMKPKLYIGIDLNDSYAMVSFLRERESEPITVSVKKDQETFQFPTSLYVGKNNHYRYGVEAEKKKFDPSGEFFDHLYLRARDLIHTDGAGEAVARLTTFIKRLLKLKENLYGTERFEQYLVITVPEMSPEATAVLDAVKKELGSEITRMDWMDYAECSYYYVYQQDSSVWAHNVALFDYSASQLTCTMLGRDVRLVPQVVMSAQTSWPSSMELDEDPTAKDRFFADIVKQAFGKRIISGVFLLGDGFDGEWMKDSLRVLTPNRRVFMGKNLYTKGSAMAALVMFSEKQWNYRYECSYKAQANVSLQVLSGDATKILPLIEMGRNWFEQKTSYNVLLKGSPEFNVYIERKGEYQQKHVVVPLEDIWNRPERTRKIRVTAQMVKNNVLKLTVTDVGFGAFYASTGKEWSYEAELYEM
ncbi:MAG: hypothetical protein IJ471_02180 [Eubacterium sp.]|nr:hypothetical protein [Eubacterium sp.]